MENVYNSLVNSFITLNLESISTQDTVSKSNTLLTNANQELSNMWTSCDESKPTDPGYGAYYYLQWAIQGHCPSGLTNPADVKPPAPLPTSGFSPPTGSYSVSQWVKDFLGNPNYSTSNLSSTFMTGVYSAYENTNPTGQSAQALLGLISQVTSLVQASAQADLQTGQNGITLLNNLAQHFESDQGPLSSATSTIVDAANNYSSALSQISA